LSEARLSKDIDLTTRESLREAERTLYEAASTDAGDFFRFEIAEESDLLSATGKKFRVVVYCGARQRSAFKMDLSVSANFPNPEELDEAPPFESIDIRGLPRITYAAWPFPRVVADKVAASFEMHEDRPSTRHRDLPDLYLLQCQVPFERRRLREAVLAELSKRGLEHPAEFRIPERESWERGWRNIAREDGLTLTSVSFVEGLSKVKAFLDPVLAEDTGGHWGPTLGHIGTPEIRSADDLVVLFEILPVATRVRGRQASRARGYWWRRHGGTGPIEVLTPSTARRSGLPGGTAPSGRGGRGCRHADRCAERSPGSRADRSWLSGPFHRER
jgi:hypothetical protein